LADFCSAVSFRPAMACRLAVEHNVKKYAGRSNPGKRLARLEGRRSKRSVGWGKVQRSLRENPWIVAIIGGALAAILAAAAIGIWKGIVSSNPTASPSASDKVVGTHAPNSNASTPASQSPSAQSATESGEGTVIAHYQIDLSDHYNIPLAQGGTPQPSLGQGDLEYVSSDWFYSWGGEVAVLTGVPATYSNCLSDTTLAGFVGSVAQGQTVCLSIHDVRAAATVLGYGTSGGVAYASLSVTVWQN